MNYFLLKSEPSSWSWSDQCKCGKKGTHWDGVRNFAAAANMRSMRIGDQAFFYHSISEKAIVGIVTIVREAYPDKDASNDKFCLVDVAALASMRNPVELKEIKKNEKLKNMILTFNPRLSVQPVTLAEWRLIVEQGKPSMLDDSDYQCP